ncbi:MAG: hydroxyacylglutathione hydrolase [Candidatus Pelagibacter sp.]|nr:hydroxyacylglutathione hydrolase [Candidatus Pelagibacter sp.]
MNVNVIPCLSDNYSYCVVDPETKKVVIVDPAEFDAVDSFLEKNNLSLDFILNTHHHGDHVDGNQSLKKKYNCKIVGFAPDHNRIPGIDILLDDGQIWEFANTEVEVHHVPGHTSGHIFYYFKKNNLAFVGDVVFSLGCGRIFEGTYEEMFASVDQIRKLPPQTKVFCGHEYTKSNLAFCMSVDPDNDDLKKRTTEIESLRRQNKPTIPTTIEVELKTNIFFRLDDLAVRKSLSLNNATDLEVFTKLRKLKDNF